MSSTATIQPHASTEPRYCAAHAVRAELIVLIPKLRAFSHMLCLEHDLAETLAKKAFARAWHTQRHIADGSNLTIWIFRVFHEEFRSHSRQKTSADRRYRDICWSEFVGEHLEEPVSELTAGIVKALGELSDTQREALILVSAGGFGCEDAAEICGTQPRTVKSRAVRARNALIKILESNDNVTKSDAFRDL